MKYQRGLTIVELVMTIVIMGILAAVVGPRFFERKDYGERLFFEETIAAVRYAQKFAIASGCAVQISVRDRGYNLLKERNCDSLAEPPDFCSAEESPIVCEIRTLAGDVYEGMNTNEVSDVGRVQPAAGGDFALIRRVAPGPRGSTATRLLTGLRYSQMLVNSVRQPASINGPANG